MEGYVESAACGLLAGRFAAAEIHSDDMGAPPLETALGALLNHVTGGANAETFQPMNVNFGLFPPLAERVKKKLRKEAYCTRALAAFDQWKKELPSTLKTASSNKSLAV